MKRMREKIGFLNCSAGAFRLLSLICALASFGSENLYAQDGLQIKDQYVITGLPPVKAIRKEAEGVIDTLQSNLVPVEETVHAVLISDENTGALSVDESEFVPVAKNSVCERVRKYFRNFRKRNRASGRARGPRTFQCDVNSVITADAAGGSCTYTPNDPYFSSQWDFGGQTSSAGIDAKEAWCVTKGSSDVVAAVIDTGVLYTHPDLQANMWNNPGEISGNGIDDDGNGYVDDVYGINAITNSGNPLDDHGHGTHCAGTIAAKSDNGIGVAGVNHFLKVGNSSGGIMGVKFLSSTGSGSLYDSIKAVDYVTMMKNRGINVKLSSNSWGCQGCYSSGLYDAIVRARDAGVLFIAAAGNNGANNDSSPHYPSNYSVSNVISVAAVDSNGNLASFSNFGGYTVHLGAPGVGIASTWLNTKSPYSDYASLNGTSMATPHVSGAIALLAGYAPFLKWDELKNATLSSVKPLPSLNTKTTTGGTLSAYNMVQGDVYRWTTRITPTPVGTPTNTPTPAPTNTPTLTPTATSTPTPHAASINVTVTNGSTPLSGARVTIALPSGNLSAYTGGNGEVVFSGIMAPVNYAVTATLAGYSFTSQYNRLDADADVLLNGSTQSYQLKALVVNTDGTPISGISISAGAFGSAVTSAQGYATFSVPYGASYSLQASASNWTLKQREQHGVMFGNTGRTFVAVK